MKYIRERYSASRTGLERTYTDPVARKMNVCLHSARLILLHCRYLQMWSGKWILHEDVNAIYIIWYEHHRQLIYKRHLHVLCLPGTTTHCRLTLTQVYVMRTTCPTSSSSAVWQAWPCITANCSMVSATWLCATMLFIKGWHPRQKGSEQTVILIGSWLFCLFSSKLSSFVLSTRWCCRSRSLSRTWSLLWVFFPLQIIT